MSNRFGRGTRAGLRCYQHGNTGRGIDGRTKTTHSPFASVLPQYPYLRLGKSCRSRCRTMAGSRLDASAFRSGCLGDKTAEMGGTVLVGVVVIACAEARAKPNEHKSRVRH